MKKITVEQFKVNLEKVNETVRKSMNKFKTTCLEQTFESLLDKWQKSMARRKKSMKTKKERKCINNNKRRNTTCATLPIPSPPFVFM